MARLARLALVLGALLLPGAFAGGAAAASRPTVAPPGNSAVSQYTEDLPTVHGGRPTHSVIFPAHGGGGPAPPGSGTSGHGGTGPAPSSVPPSVVRQLSGSGSAGQSAALLAQATAPPATATPNHGAARQQTGSPAAKQPLAPATSVIRALGGSTGGGGLGAFLPVLLIGLLVLLSALGIFTRWRSR